MAIGLKDTRSRTDRGSRDDGGPRRPPGGGPPAGRRPVSTLMGSHQDTPDIRSSCSVRCASDASPRPLRASSRFWCRRSWWAPPQAQLRRRRRYAGAGDRGPGPDRPAAPRLPGGATRRSRAGRRDRRPSARHPGHDGAGRARARRPGGSARGAGPDLGGTGARESERRRAAADARVLARRRVSRFADGAAAPDRRPAAHGGSGRARSHIEGWLDARGREAVDLDALRRPLAAREALASGAAQVRRVHGSRVPPGGRRDDRADAGRSGRAADPGRDHAGGGRRAHRRDPLRGARRDRAGAARGRDALDGLLPARPRARGDRVRDHAARIRLRGVQRRRSLPRSPSTASPWRCPRGSGSGCSCSGSAC